MIACSALALADNPPKPDFTKGEPIPKDARKDWTLGATGTRGWMHTENFATTSARQIKLTAVDAGSPADGILRVGDVVLGVAGKMFSHDPRTEFGKALTAAEAADGKLSLTLWRDGEQFEVIIPMSPLGSYSATAPYDCPKSAKILELGCEALAKRMAAPDYHKQPGINACTRSLNAMALLASGKKEYLPLVKKEVEWASGFQERGMVTWWYGYVLMFLAEYQLATGDDAGMPGLTRIAMESANGQSAVGSWGHGFAKPDGRLAGYGMMNAPGLPLTSALIMARMAGVKDPKLDLAIDRSAKLLRFYAGKGSVPYGDHDPWMQGHEDNGKCSMAAVLFNLLGEKQNATFFSRMGLAAHGAERDCGHTGNFWNMTWAVPGVSQGGQHATGAWFEEFGAWYFDLARTWDHRFPHQGPPQPNPDSTGSWDATGAYLIAYAMPLKKLVLTGKLPPSVDPLDEATARQIVIDGRGWSQGDKFSAYDSMDGDALLEALGSWSPIVRERAAIAISRRKQVPLEPILTLLDSPSLERRLGACQTLIALGARSAPAVPKLRGLLRAEDLWLRIKAAEALAAIGKPAMEVVPELLTMLAKGPSESDPRAMEQRYLSFALFSGRGLLARSLDGVDRGQLYTAVRAGLHNQDGRARGAFASVYQNLTFEEIKPLLPAIHEAIVIPAPSGIMFADQIQTEGLKLLAKYKIREGLELTARYVRDQKPHASQIRIHEILEILKKYGAHGQSVIPMLEEHIVYFETAEPDFPKQMSMDKAKAVRETIAFIKASQDKPELVSLKDL